VFIGLLSEQTSQQYKKMFNKGIPLWESDAVKMPVPAGKAIDLFGNPIDLEAAGSAYAGIFQTVQEKSHKAVATLSQLGVSHNDSQQNSMFPKSVQVDFFLTAPGG